MRNLRLTLSYDGTDFHGWQRQPGLRTVQGELETAIESLTQVRPGTTACSRTDAGVHALGQVVHFLTTSSLPPPTIHKALNALCPRDLRILAVEDKPQSFHATLDARSKRYRYVIDNGPIADPFRLRYAWHVFHPLDLDSMQRASRVLLGRHDFRCFETEWPNRTSSVRTIMDLAVARGGHAVTIEVQADGFLYNMVRAITGSLVLVGTGRRPESWIAEILRAEDRGRAGPTAPPHGLFLVEAHYGPESAL